MSQFKPFFGKVIGDYHKQEHSCALNPVPNPNPDPNPDPNPNPNPNPDPNPNPNPNQDPECALEHVNDWDISGVGEGGVLDLEKIGMTEPISMRVRVGRNLAAFNLPGAMDKAERIKFEQTMLAAFDKLIATEGYGGKVYSITPDFGEAGPNPNFIDDAKYQELVDKHVMFKDMDADPYLKSAGISSDAINYR